MFIVCATDVNITTIVVAGYAQDDRVIDETPLTVKVIAATTAILPCSADPKYTEAKSDEYRVSKK